ncbi:MAG: alanine--tRNA ligase [Infirmifilum sp.]|uniref:alanine--tRNA ligase n=1 Tax=Infirmifilum sp. TaxID=2856575 RepID=UPI003D096B29
MEDFENLPFFLENGWIKKKCPYCGRVFWTLNPNRETCGDQPCEPYSFIGEKVGKHVESITEVRSSFIRFFEERGHTPVKRYPVVARWREDVYLVGASIYDFQPWVTEGLVSPPANPLVISQPSIRLTDVDNVGKTSRHLTGFEMMAHHAFNFPGKSVYWANETVEYAFNLFTRVYGIRPDEITFVYDMWSGGGNAGEDYEVLVRGLEVATLVFMHYKTRENGELVPIQNRIVDTGYGLERIYWLLTGKYNVYEAVFPEIIEYLRNQSGVGHPDPHIMAQIARLSGRLDYKKPIEAYETLTAISKSLGMSLEELRKHVEPHESIYAIADHTRSLLWMIGDGIVPSNTGAGYLARLLIRRSLRYMWRLGLQVRLAEVISKQIEKWKSDFPEYFEIQDEILDIIDEEENRFRETLQRGDKIISEVISNVLSSGASEIPSDTLVTLYESHGIPPEVLEEKAAKYNLKVNTVGFYSRLAELRSRSQQGQKEALSIAIDPSQVKGFPPTRKLYYEDEKLANFTATVLGVLDGKYVILDKTAFYPEGGGQLTDVGRLEFNGQTCEVERVIKVGDVILHQCRGKIPEKGLTVNGYIDIKRRLNLMRHHTATHVVLGALRRVLGRHVWQAGALKTEEYVRFDFTHHKSITPEQARMIEYLANSVVWSNRPVRKYLLERTQAEQKYGFTLYQGGAVPEKILRIVEIEGWDAEACGGTHVDNTGEIGIIKILGFEKIQDGVVRVVFKAGEPALKHIQEQEAKIQSLKEILQATDELVVEKARELVRNVEVLEKEVKRLREQILTGSYQQTISPVYRKGDVEVYLVESSDMDPREVATTLGKSKSNAIVLAYSSDGRIALKVNDKLLDKYDAREIGRRLCDKLGGRGGGVKDLFQGRISNTKDLKEALIHALEAQ